MLSKLCEQTHIIAAAACALTHVSQLLKFSDEAVYCPSLSSAVGSSSVTRCSRLRNLLSPLTFHCKQRLHNLSSVQVHNFAFWKYQEGDRQQGLESSPENPALHPLPRPPRSHRTGAAHHPPTYSTGIGLAAQQQDC